MITTYKERPNVDYLVTCVDNVEDIISSIKMVKGKGLRRAFIPIPLLLIHTLTTVVSFSSSSLRYGNKFKKQTLPTALMSKHCWNFVFDQSTIKRRPRSNAWKGSNSLSPAAQPDNTSRHYKPFQQ